MQAQPELGPPQVPLRPNLHPGPTCCLPPPLKVMGRRAAASMLAEVAPGAEVTFVDEFFTREDSDGDGLLRAADLARRSRLCAGPAAEAAAGGSACLARRFTPTGAGGARLRCGGRQCAGQEFAARGHGRGGPGAGGSWEGGRGSGSSGCGRERAAATLLPTCLSCFRGTGAAAPKGSCLAHERRWRRAEVRRASVVAVRTNERPSTGVVGYFYYRSVRRGGILLYSSVSRSYYDTAARP